MLELLQRLFDGSFMPHGHCYLWKPGLLWLHVGSDAMIAGAYFVIPLLLIWFMREREDLAFKWMFALFGAFIFLCGLTHLFRIVTVWQGIYWFEGGVKLITGSVSVVTAALLVPLVPKALKLPTPTELRKANEALQEEIEQRKQAEKELEEAYRKLKETERLKDEFFANVSHELRTPLTLILSPVESLLDEAQEGPSSNVSASDEKVDEGAEEVSENQSSDGGTQDDRSIEEGSTEEEVSGALTPEQRGRLETVHNNSIRMLQMVNGLLDFSKLEIGEVEVDRELTGIEGLTRSICKDFGPLSRRKGIDLDFESSVESSVVEMDRYLYERILFNLLSNAVKFTSEGGEVWVRLSQDQDRLELTVADTGKGIPEEELETIFKDFRQLDASSTRRFEGTGLGLPLVKEFAELLEGSVSVESTPGVGSTFTVELRAPVLGQEVRPEPDQGSHTLVQQYRIDDEAAIDSAPAHSEPGTGEEGGGLAPGGERHAEGRLDEERPDVVLAEDNKELSAYIRDLLAGTCRVHVARDGEEAMTLIRSVGPSLVITDIMMPGKDGLEVCRELKASPVTVNIPVVMLTALTNRKALLRGWEAGADEYLFKPFHPKELVTRVRTLLRNVERYREAEESKKKLEQELLRASERERRRIGQDIHDGLASHMTGLSTMVQALKARGQKGKGGGTIQVKSLDRIIELAQEGARQARALAKGLNPVKLDEKGLPAALQTLAENQEFRYNVTCEFEEKGPLPELSDDASINLYWIAHEAVHNAIKNGEASRVWIRLHGETGQAVLEITDDGTGLPKPIEEIEGGMGLTTMRYRSDLIGADLDVQDREEGGVKVLCRVSTSSAPEDFPPEETVA